MRTTEARPTKLFHGTPYQIHSSDRPFLDPHLTQGRDEGEPTGPFVCATSNEETARLFTLKSPQVITIFHDIPNPAIVFREETPNKKAGGWLYEIPVLSGFHRVLRRGKHKGKWAIAAEDMPLVKDRDGREIPGISLRDAAVRRIELQELLTESNLSLYTVKAITDPEAYRQATRDAIYHERENDFLLEAVERGWLINITDKLLEE